MYVPFIMLWRQKASSARQQEGPRNKAAATCGCSSEHKTETAAQGILQDMGPNEAAATKIYQPPAARASPCPQEGMSQERTPVSGLEFCTLPNQPKQTFT